MFDFVSNLTPGKAFDKGLIGNTVDRFFMSSVKDTIMEAFVQGIQACLAEDWDQLTRAF